MRVVDVHSHILPADAVDELRRLDARAAPQLVPDASTGLFWGVSNGKRFGPFGRGAFDVEERMREHRERRIDVQALAVVPYVFNYSLEAPLAAKFAQVLNDQIAEIVRTFPDRSVALATVPLQDPPRAAAELERAMTAHGMRGAMIGTHVNGRDLDDDALEPFWAAAERLRAFIFVHPIAGSTERLGRYYLGNLVGRPLETTLAIASLLFGGVIARHPELVLCFAHGGGFVPFQLGRFDHGWRTRPEPRERIDHPPSQDFARLYFDSIVHSDEVLRFLTRSVGATRVLLGSDYPFDMGPADPRASVAEVDGLSTDERDAILGTNAARLLRLD
jgi:aminocarboxymuconate-semialdehyde decarboxylase